MMHPGRLNRFGLIARTVAISQQMRIGYGTPAEERRSKKHIKEKHGKL